MSVITCTFTSFHTSPDKSKQYFDLKDNTVLLILINHKVSSEHSQVFKPAILSVKLHYCVSSGTYVKNV